MCRRSAQRRRRFVLLKEYLLYRCQIFIHAEDPDSMIVETEGKMLKRKRKLSDSVSEQIQADNMEVSGQNHNMHG